MPIDMPSLKIIALTDLILHEEPDPSRTEQLAGKLRQQGILRNPPLVLPTTTGNDRFMVLDGANRVTAFKNLGYPHIIAQVIQNEDSDINLFSWNHLVWGQPVDDFFLSIKQAFQNKLELFASNRKQISTNDTRSIQIQFTDHNSYSIRMETDLTAALEQIHMITSCYKGKMQFNRTDVYDIGNFEKVYDPLIALIVFPLFESFIHS